MEKLDLNGEWLLGQAGKEDSIPAKVPGCVHADLLANGLIDDPYYRDNEDKLQWIGEAEWEYSRSFEVDGGFLANERIELDCLGLDTFAVIRINGKELARTDNMFRHWRWRVRDLLKPGTNSISVYFRSTLPYIREKQEERRLHTIGVDHKIDGGQWVRKEQCNYGWDWGPMLVTCGIWRSISLKAWSHPVLDDVLIRQKHHFDGSVELELGVSIDSTPAADCSIQARLELDDRVAGSVGMPIAGSSATVSFVVDNPQLWWPHGMGEQPLYKLTVLLYDGDDSVVDERVLRIGLRQLELIRETDQWGESFKFRANGRDFFAKGANWIPADTFDARVDRTKLHDLLKGAVWANMNCIRVWGGGIYERDDFYDLCDELGLVVWQDFMFACSPYPAHEKDFLENVRAEAVDNVKRLRHHSCILLWCGNNELEQIPGVIGDAPTEMRWHDYAELFDKLLKEVVEDLDGQRPYWPSSEHSPIGNRVGHYPNGQKASEDPRWGDAHLWEVWHGLKPYEWYRTSYHRFCSEFGFQSFPHPQTVIDFTDDADRNITSYVMEKHQRSPIGNAAIIHYMLSWFQLPVGNENTVWASQLLQALAIKYAVEHWRRNMPRCMGALYWQLNDCWPGPTWASIDNAHRWKTLHYAARRFFAPILISGVEDLDKQSVAVHISSDLKTTQPARLQADWVRGSGESVPLHSAEVSIPADGSIAVTELDLSDQVEADSERGGLVYLRLLDGDTLLSDNVVHLVRPKHLELEEPHIDAEWGTDGDGLPCVTLRTDKPSLWTWPHVAGHPDLRWSDSFFPLMPGQPKTIHLLDDSSKNSLDHIKQVIEWRTLTSLCKYSPAKAHQRGLNAQ